MGSTSTAEHRPDAGVLAAFGLRGAPRPVPGGQGGCWRVGATMLKRVTDPVAAGWAADLAAGLPEHPAFQLPRPVAGDGAWLVGPWSAWTWVDGSPRPGRHEAILRAADAFHDAVRDVAEPEFLARRTDVWAHADRVAWAELPPPADGPYAELVQRLAAWRVPITVRRQLVHADLRLNVLFAGDAPPAIIDVSPLWRPRAWARAVVAVDSLDAGQSDRWMFAAQPDPARWWQLLVRAELFRLVVKNEAGRRGLRLVDDKPHHHATAQLLAAHGERHGWVRPERNR
jgi:uncharacterized protein (TIGR02569 family)